MILQDEYFIVYRNRRRLFISGREPLELRTRRVIDSRAWNRYQNVMKQETAWEKALGYKKRMEAEGFQSVRELAKAVAVHHSGAARILEILKLPREALEALQKHSGNARVRAHFTEKRLRQLVRNHSKAEILCEIERFSNPEMHPETSLKKPSRRSQSLQPSGMA